MQLALDRIFNASLYHIQDCSIGCKVSILYGITQYIFLKIHDFSGIGSLKFMIFREFRAIEDTNGHEWIINKNIHGSFMEIRVFYSLAFKDMNGHEWIINKIFMTIHGYSCSFILWRLKTRMGMNGS